MLKSCKNHPMLPRINFLKEVERMFKKIFLPLILFLFNQSVFAAPVGWSAYPFKEGQRMVSGEIGGVFSEGGGLGFQATYLQKLSSQWALEGGTGVTGGERGFTLFGDADY